MLRGCSIPLLATLAIAAACMNAERSAEEEPDYDVVVTEAPDDSQPEFPPDSDVDVGDTDMRGSPALPGSPPTVGATPPGEFPADEQAVGWVSVIASDGYAYEVLQDGSVRGLSTVRLTQRPGEAVYVLRNENGEVMCRARVEVRQYESVCLQCDVETGKFRRESC
jgi:hypothetical protein